MKMTKVTKRRITNVLIMMWLLLEGLVFYVFASGPMSMPIPVPAPIRAPYIMELENGSPLCVINLDCKWVGNGLLLKSGKEFFFIPNVYVIDYDDSREVFTIPDLYGFKYGELFGGRKVEEK